MSAFYTEMAGVAVDLFDQFGTEVTLNRVTGEQYDPVTGNEFEGDAAPVTTKGLVTFYPVKLIDGTRILATDIRLIIDGSVEPLITDIPEMNGEKLGTIVNIEAKNPTGTPLVYFLQVRK